MAAMKRMQEKRSGAAHKKVLAQSAQQFAEMEAGGAAGEQAPDPNVGIGAGSSGFIGSMAKSYAMGQIGGALAGQAGGAGGGLSEAAASEAGVLPGAAGSPAMFGIPESAITGTQASQIAEGVGKFFNQENLQKYMKLKGMSNNLFGQIIDSLLSQKSGGGAVADFFKSKGGNK
jgi:hypothetical protein